MVKKLPKPRPNLGLGYSSSLLMDISTTNEFQIRLGRQPQSPLKMKRKEEEELEERFREIILSYTHDSHSPAKMVPEQKWCPLMELKIPQDTNARLARTTVWPSSVILTQDASSTTLAAT